MSEVRVPVEKYIGLILTIFKQVISIFKYILFIIKAIIYHVVTVFHLTYELIIALVQGTSTWVVMTSRLFGFVLLLGSGWARMLLYYFTNKHILKHIHYGNAPRNYLDIYLPMKLYKQKHKSKHNLKIPVVILVSGGAWIIGYKMWNALIARGLSYYGYIVVLPDYRNYPQGNISDMVCDIRQSLEWVVGNIEKYGGDGNNIIFGGQSAGGHISLSVLVELYKESQSVPISGYYSPKHNYNSNKNKNESSEVITEEVSSHSRELLSRIKLYIGISAPYNITETCFHLHNRGLDYSIIKWIFNNDLAKYSASVELARLAGIPLNISKFRIVRNGNSNNNNTSRNNKKHETESESETDGDGLELEDDSTVTRMCLSNNLDDDYMLNEYNYYDAVGYKSKSNNYSSSSYCMSGLHILSRYLPTGIVMIWTHCWSFVENAYIVIAHDYNEHYNPKEEVNEHPAVEYATKPRTDSDIDISYDISQPINTNVNSIHSSPDKTNNIDTGHGNMNNVNNVSSSDIDINMTDIINSDPVSTSLKGFPPVALFHGKLDKCIPFYTAIELSRILKLGGLSPQDIHVSIYNHWGHTDGMLEDLLCGEPVLIDDLYKIIHCYAPITDPEETHIPFKNENENFNNVKNGNDEIEAYRIQMKLYTPYPEEIGTLGTPHVAMVSKTMATIAKLMNPF